MEKEIIVQGKLLRTELIENSLWYCASDIFSLLNITWRGLESLKKKHISSNDIITLDVNTKGGIQKLIYCSEKAVIKILMVSKKSKIADNFTNWVCEFLVKYRIALKTGNNNEIKDFYKKQSENLFQEYIKAGII